MTLYQLAQALAFLLGSLLGAAVLELVGVGRLGYMAIFLASSLMRFVTPLHAGIPRTQRLAASPPGTRLPVCRDRPTTGRHPDR